MTQRNNLKFGILLLAFLIPMALIAQRGEKITTVVIDPGHGGKDTGALGAISKEKDLNLTVALLTGDYIKKNLPDVKVIYTRERDVFVDLGSLYAWCLIAGCIKTPLLVAYPTVARWVTNMQQPSAMWLPMLTKVWNVSKA